MVVMVVVKMVFMMMMVVVMVIVPMMITMMILVTCFVDPQNQILVNDLSNHQQNMTMIHMLFHAVLSKKS